MKIGNAYFVLFFFSIYFLVSCGENKGSSNNSTNSVEEWLKREHRNINLMASQLKWHDISTLQYDSLDHDSLLENKFFDQYLMSQLRTAIISFFVGDTITNQHINNCTSYKYKTRDPYLINAISYWQIAMTELDHDSEKIMSVVSKFDINNLNLLHLKVYIYQQEVLYASFENNQNKIREWIDKGRSLAYSTNDSITIQQNYFAEYHVMQEISSLHDLTHCLDSAYKYTNKNDTFSMVELLQLKSKLYSKFSMLDEAGESIRLAFDLTKNQAKYQLVEGISCNILGSIFEDRGEYDSSILYSKRAYWSLIENNWLYDVTSLTYVLARQYHRIGEIDSANHYINLALENSIKFPNPSDSSIMLALMYLEKGKIHSTQKQYDQVLPNYFHALKIARSMKSENDLEKIHDEIANYYEENNQFDSAYKHRGYQLALKDSLNNKTIQKARENLLYNQEIRDKREQILSLELDRLALEKKAAKSKTNLIIWIAITVISGITIFFFSFLRRRKIELRLQAYELMVKEYETTINSFENEIAQIEIHSLTKERKRIASALHDGLLSELAGIVQLSDNMQKEGISNPKLSNLTVGSKKVYEKARKMLHDLSDIDKEKQEDLFSLQLSEFIENYITPIGIKTKIKFNDIQKFNQLHTKAQIQLLYCSKEILANILKHSKAKNLQIQTYFQNGKCNLSFSDDGIGFDIEKAKEGLGMKNIKKRINSVNGSFQVVSKKYEGTISTIIIPLQF